MSKPLPHIRIPCSWIRGKGAQLSSKALHLYLVMLSYRDKNTGICYTGQSKLGELIGVSSTRYIRSLIAELTDLELIWLVVDDDEKSIKSQYRTNQYYVHDPMNIHLL